MTLISITGFRIKPISGSFGTGSRITRLAIAALHRLIRRYLVGGSQVTAIAPHQIPEIIIAG